MLQKRFGKLHGPAPAARGGSGPNHTTLATVSAFRQTENRLLASVNLGNRRKEVTIDTGASRSYVSERLADELRSENEVMKVDNTISLANGTPVELREEVSLDVGMGGKSGRVEMGVMPKMIDNALLGLDFLRAVRAEIRIGTEVIKLEPLPQSRRGALVRAEGPVTREVPANDETRIAEFLSEELAKFEGIEGPTPLTKHAIVLKDDRPVRQRYSQRNPEMQRRINEEVDELLKNGCIEPSKSPYSAPIVMAPKKNGTYRLCIDYRLLNARTVADAYPLPRINHILDRLRNAKFISSIDLKNGYWQIPMAEGSKEYTAFTVAGKGLFQWKVMPFGLTSAPATFQRTLDRVIGAEMEPHAFAYLDDIVVLGGSLEEHMANLKEVFRRLREARLKINHEKSKFFQKEIKYLGHVVNESGIHTDPDKIAAIRELTPPTNVRELRRCLGIASWYRRFVPDFSKISQPLTSLLKKGKHFRWNQEQQEAFELLKKQLTEAPVLACPDFTQKFTLQTDACDYGLGAVLTQELDGQERVIAYASRRLNQAETNYSPTEKECLAIVWAIRKLRPYLEGYHFSVITDHLSLKWLNSIESPSGRVARWALELQQYSFDVQYRRGKLNVIADALSRQPVEVCQAVIEKPKECVWWKNRCADVKQFPQKFPDYTIINEQLYRHISTRDGDEEDTPWKLCVPVHQRRRVRGEP